MTPLLLMLASGTAPVAPADLVVTGAKIWRDGRPDADALAVRDGRVVAVGTEADVRSLVGPQTRVLDAAGRRLLPGFNDSHAHVLGSGLRLSQVALKDAADPAEFGRRIAEFDARLPRDRWMLGGDWDHDRTFAGRLPTAADLDRHAPDRPVFLRRYDGHMALANSRALQLAGITADTADPPGGVIVRDPQTRRPTGLLRDAAMSLVDAVVPPPDEAAIAEGLKAALDELARHGVTAVQDMDGSDAATRRTLFRQYQRLAKAGRLTCRVELRWPLAEWRELARLGVESDFGNPYLRIGGLKGFADGSLGSSTAKMFEPFVNEPDSTGVFVTPREQLLQWVRDADAAGLSVAVHAIGDRANAELLDIYAEVARVNGPRDRRFRIEHAQHLRPADYARFAELGVIASMQPYHVIDDGRWAEGRIGRARCASSYAFRSLLDAGAVLAFGSDWAVAPLDVPAGIAAAVHRRTLDGLHPGGWFAEQKITAEEAVRAYTLGSAIAARRDHELGRLEPGHWADFVLLSRDVLAPDQRDAIADTKVLLTVVGGKIVHEMAGR